MTYGNPVWSSRSRVEPIRSGYSAASPGRQLLIREYAWHGGDAWINTNTLGARVNFASQMVNTMSRQSGFRAQIENVFMNGDRAAAPQQAVESLWNNMLPGRSLNNTVQAVLVDYVQGGADKNPPKVISGKLPGLVNLVLGSPDYQLA